MQHSLLVDQLYHKLKKMKYPNKHSVENILFCNDFSKYRVSNIEMCLLKVLKKLTENEFISVNKWAFFQEHLGLRAL